MYVAKTPKQIFRSKVLSTDGAFKEEPHELQGHISES